MWFLILDINLRCVDISENYTWGGGAHLREGNEGEGNEGEGPTAFGSHFSECFSVLGHITKIIYSRFHF